MENATQLVAQVQGLLTVCGLKVIAVIATLTTADNKTIMIPNARVDGGNITNYSSKETRRVNLVMRMRAKTTDYWGVYFDATESVKQRLDEAGIGIPYPQRDVHLYEYKVA